MGAISWDEVTGVPSMVVLDTEDDEEGATIRTDVATPALGVGLKELSGDMSILESDCTFLAIL